jgi:hypothetical protein
MWLQSAGRRSLREGDGMRTRAFDPDDPEFVENALHARIVVFSTACILASLLVIIICIPLLLAEL